MANLPKAPLDSNTPFNTELALGGGRLGTDFTLADAAAFQNVPRTAVAVLNLPKFDTFIGGLEPTPIRDEPRVVSQSVPAGTLLAPGTPVNLIMARLADIPFDIFETPHLNLATKTVKEVLDVLDTDAAVRQTFVKFSNPADVPQAEKQALIAKFNLQISDAQANTSFDAAFNSIRSALTFG
jgi:hypothetical protein